MGGKVTETCFLKRLYFSCRSANEWFPPWILPSALCCKSWQWGSTAKFYLHVAPEQARTGRVKVAAQIDYSQYSLSVLSTERTLHFFLKMNTSFFNWLTWHNETYSTSHSIPLHCEKMVEVRRLNFACLLMNTMFFISLFFFFSDKKLLIKTSADNVFLQQGNCDRMFCKWAAWSRSAWTCEICCCNVCLLHIVMI